MAESARELQFGPVLGLIEAGHPIPMDIRPPPGPTARIHFCTGFSTVRAFSVLTLIHCLFPSFGASIVLPVATLLKNVPIK